ncbi:aminoglycoside adenylyltransferase domain-containing protein [Mesobacillus thioparans]|uniref:aminoglycoside adenylyltransferase domain-containing protein n=1 Tax=Mesobacillus thioparans TaxID=370439 RepID=UPI0039F04C15
MGIPVVVHTVLKEYMNLFNEHFPGTMKRLYVHGSIALNAYVEDSSDIDFITLTNRRLTEKDLDALTFIHRKIANKYEKPELDGVYALREDLGKLYDGSDKNDYKYPYYNNGEISFGDYFNFNPITWWVLKRKGISILEEEPEGFHFDIQPHQLYSYVLANMNSYWTNRVQTAEASMEQLLKLPSSTLDFEIEWTVLGLLRQFYTIKENDIVSKLDAGEYGLCQLPAEWHDIIKEAMNIRRCEMSEIFNSEKERLEVTLRFSRFLIGYCNNSFKNQISF